MKKYLLEMAFNLYLVWLYYKFALKYFIFYENIFVYRNPYVWIGIIWLLTIFYYYYKKRTNV